MQIHPGVNNGGRQRACVRAPVHVRLFLGNDSTSLCQCPDAVSAWLLRRRLRGPGVNQQECFIALQLAVSSQRYDSILSCGMQSHGV